MLPTARLSPDFLKLSTGLAGEVLQKFVNYRFGVTIVGDISGHVAASDALGDFVRESNRGKTVWFADDLEGLESRPERGGDPAAFRPANKGETNQDRISDVHRFGLCSLRDMVA